MLEMIYDNGLSQVLITIRFLIPHHLLKLKEWHDNELQLLKEHARYFVAHFVSKMIASRGIHFQGKHLTDLILMLKQL